VGARVQGPGLGEQSWFCANEAHVQAFDRGAFLLDIKYVPMRWWPLRAFAFIEPLEPVEGAQPLQPSRTPERAAVDWRA
jgi:hypothetical protein